MVVPLTCNIQCQYPGETLVTIKGKSVKVMADQIMVSDKTGLKDQLDTLSKADMLAIEDVILINLGMLR